MTESKDMKEYPLKVTFKAWELDGIIYIMVPKEDWQLLTESPRHIIITSLSKLPKT